MVFGKAASLEAVEKASSIGLAQEADAAARRSPPRTSQPAAISTRPEHGEAEIEGADELAVVEQHAQPLRW